MKHKWESGAGFRCTTDIDRAGETPFGIHCGRSAVKGCLARHGGPGFQVCGAAYCRKHAPKAKPRTPGKGRRA